MAQFATTGIEGLRAARYSFEAFGLAIEYLFKGWPFRKIYLEVADYNLNQFGSILRRFAREEGRLRDHLYLDRRWWDLVLIAIWRDDWEMRTKTQRRGLSGGQATST
jgi:RimJ/RimL family protein N-acetyltransferase